MQVLATGGIPAALCLLPFAGLKLHWKLCYLAYLACCCGDTLASEFGQLSSQRPLLILDFSPVSSSSHRNLNALPPPQPPFPPLTPSPCSFAQFFSPLVPPLPLRSRGVVMVA